MPCWSEPITAENKRRFPLLNSENIYKLVEENAAISVSRTYNVKEIVPQRVPTAFMGHTLHQFVNRRRIDVIKDCVSFIFDNKISDARKVNKFTVSHSNLLVLQPYSSFELSDFRTFFSFLYFDLQLKNRGGSFSRNFFIFFETFFGL